ncbi:MAG: hypothetical protein ACYDGR_12925 [Candidatus Dormibacteria bacterium]
MIPAQVSAQASTSELSLHAGISNGIVNTQTTITVPLPSTH